MLQWKKRCVKDQTAVSDRKIWETKCGRFRVVFSHIRYGGGVLPDSFLAMELEIVPGLEHPVWGIISRHRKREKAEEACELRATTPKKRR